MPVTIKDVALRAGVSISTVSKVINNGSNISDATKEKVRSIMKELNYYPNIIAKSFAQRNSYNIGVLMDLKRSDAFINSHLYEILGGIEEVAQQNGYFLTLSNMSSVIKNDTLDKIVMQKGVDGLIIQVNNLTKSTCQRLDDLSFPYIVIGQPKFESKVCWIDSNNKLAGEIAASHLIEEGYERIAFIGGPDKDDISKNREAGYRNSLQEHSIKVNKSYIKEGETNTENGYTLMNELLDLPNPPDSLVCTNNFMAVGAMRAIKERGLKIPDDVAVIAFDNYPLSQFTEPPMSVVDIDVFELGVHAANALMNKLRNPNLQVQYSMLSPTLIVRESSKKAKI